MKVEGGVLLLFTIILNACSRINTAEKISVNRQIQHEIINSRFSNHPLGDIAKEEKGLTSSFAGMQFPSRIPIQNIYNGEMDTLLAYRNRNSLVRFYKSSEKILLDSLDIRDSNFIRMMGGLDIGMSKPDFLRYFQAVGNEFGDSIAVIDEERTVPVHFYFKEDKLVRIQILHW